MKNFKLIFALFLFFLSYTGVVNATDYYICDCDVGADINCIAGDDTNSGTSINSPWRTTAKVNSVMSSLQAGDQILFAKGGAWTDAEIRIFNLNSTELSPITLDSYDPIWGGTAKPILTEARANKHLLRFENGGPAAHDEGYIVRNLDLRGGGTGLWGVFIFNDADHILMENLDISNFKIGVHSAGANPPSPGADDQNQHVSLLNSTIKNCSTQGFLGAGDYLLIEDCLFENNGFSLPIYGHNVYVSSSDHVIIRNNELYKSAINNGMAQGVSLVAHGVLDDLLIEGNYVHEDAGMVTGYAWGIAVDTGYATAESFTNLIIRGNLLVNMFNVGIGVSSAPGAIIENNIIINEDAASLTAIAVPDRIRGANDMEMTNVTVRNNSIYLRNANMNTKGILVGEEGSDHKIVSNILSMDDGSGFTMNLSDSNYADVDYNMMELLNNANWGAGQSLSCWLMSREFDLHSITGDPQFTSPGSPNYNLRPLTTSPVVDAGHPDLSSSIDYTGATRSGISDIGAYEFFVVLSISDSEIDFNKNIIKNFPNPTNGQIILKSDISMIGTTYVAYNFIGQPILKGKIISEKTVVDLENYPTGNYLIVFGGKTSQIIKVLKR